MEVIRAESAGTCYGVKRAIDIAHDCAQSSASSKTWGPLIHNPQLVAELEDKGVGVAQSLDDVDCDTIIIRSHGVTPAVLNDLESTSVNIVDATCPHVLKAQKAAYDFASQGRTVIIVGEKSHPEVQGLCAWAQECMDDVHVVLEPADIPGDLKQPVGVVAQTTITQDTLSAITDALSDAEVEYEVSNTICNATTKRQDAARLLAERVDGMVVVGGRNSSNTKHLFDICVALCPKTVHVERADELSADDFEGCKRIGVTAGASTPEDQIAVVEDLIRKW